MQYINGERDNRLLRSSDRQNENFGNDDIAICGMSCRFPGSGMSPEEYFEALLSATDATREVPAEWKDAVGTTKAGFLDDYVAEMFDAGFFGLSQEEIRMANPHQRLLLEVGHEALVNAGLAEEQVGKNTAEDKQNNVGVYVGLCNNEWIPSEKDRKSPYASMNHAGASAANRLSFLLHLQGPSMVIDTACSSSLVAVHTACQALKTGDCDAALVASADLMVSPYSLMTRSAAGMLSEDGINRTFDAAANGYVRGEGAGAIVLKRLRDVEREPSSSPILAVIRSSSVNQDGRSATFMAPNGEAQKELLLQSLEKARVQPSDVSYIETHGTGTPLGDPIEWGAIRSALLPCKEENELSMASPLIVGAVKTNIGHLEGTAGMAGLIKAVMCLQERKVPPNLHLSKLNPLIAVPDAGSGYRTAVFPSSVVPLKNSSSPSPDIALVSSFGSGGTNANVILSSGPPLVSPSMSVRSRKPAIFMFTGQGISISKSSLAPILYAQESVFAKAVKLCSNALPTLSPSLEAVMYGDTAAEIDSNSHLSSSLLYQQLAHFTVQVALSALWRSKGVTPGLVSGHSLGEFAASVVCGALPLEVAVQLVAIRASALEESVLAKLSGRKGIMVACRATPEAARKALPRDSSVTIAAINGPSSIVLSGWEQDVEAVVQCLGVSHKRLGVALPYHSSIPLLVDAAKDFAQQSGHLLASVNRDGQGTFFAHTFPDVISSSSSTDADRVPDFVSCLTGSPCRWLNYWIPRTGLSKCSAQCFSMSV